jgi:magnesium transporter
MTRERSDTLSLLKADLNQNRLVEAFQLLVELHPADIADLFEALDEDEKKKLFRELDIDTASEVIAELSEFSQDQILADLPRQRLGEKECENLSDRECTWQFAETRRSYSAPGTTANQIA